MVLGPEQIHERQFRLVRQTTGYDMDDVDGFLDEVEAEVTRLTAGLESAAQAAADAEAQLRAVEDLARLERRRAELEAQLGELAAQRDRMEASIAGLRSIESELRTRLGEFLEGQLEQLRAFSTGGSQRS